jgi:hypothetical protein
MSREERLAADFEELAAALRAGEATLYGYRVRTDPPVERGAVAAPAGWFEFEFRHEK